ncbi:MAG TPA: MoaD/ThiS family protein [Puia sp.]|nr:MoaD/ThiS family protein [Puia sp.]
MATVKFTYALRRFFPAIRDTVSRGTSLEAILREMEAYYPGISGYILDEQGQLRRHVNIFIDGALIKDRVKLSDSIGENSEIYVMQALSGG